MYLKKKTLCNAIMGDLYIYTIMENKVTKGKLEKIMPGMISFL